MNNLNIPFIIAGVCLFFALLLSGCANTQADVADLTEYEPNITLDLCDIEDSYLNCEFDITAPKEALYLQLDVAQYSSGDFQPLLTGGISIGEERLPVKQIAGRLQINASNRQPLSIRMSCSGEAEYTIPSSFFDCAFQPDMNGAARTPALHETIQLAKLESTAGDAYIDINISFGNDMNAFLNLKNS